MKLRRPRKIVVLVALVATLSLLCCGGAVTTLLVSTYQRNPTDMALAANGCSTAGPINPLGKLPQMRIGPYGAEQLRNAAVIIKTGADLKMPPRAWVIAVATAMQESNLINSAAQRDHDSVGLFQQRPSMGWGTIAQIMNPTYAATKFYNKLKTVQGWENMALTRAAQRVQRSGFPGAYAKHEALATEIVNSLAHGAARAVGNSVSIVCMAMGGKISAGGWTLPVLGAIVGSGFRTAERPAHQGVDLIIGRYAPIHATAAGIVSLVKCDEDHRGLRTCDLDGYPGKGGCGWMVEIQHAGHVMTRYCHMVQRPFVVAGQRVAAGQRIGLVGTSGNSSGPHLHFEVHLNYDRRSVGAVNPVPFMIHQGVPLSSSRNAKENTAQ